ncbi:hypothetical protein AB3662_10100 [Sorangium cellulosum]|uniref:hypothetical protein n=1 Tax=Sorangium cellulosum TaxID=56 RepID=UPI003D9A3332
MCYRLDAPERLAWLEVEGDGVGPRQVRCPRKEDEMTDTHACFACKRFGTLAIHPTGKKVYVVCEPFAETTDEGA